MIMKTYIFVTQNISNVGGAQIYTRNKTNYLKNKGWNVVVFSFNKGTVYIQDLKPYQNGVLEELIMPSYNYTRRQQIKLINQMIALIGKADEYIIESHSVRLSTWGELLAQELRGWHFLYSLVEKPELYSFVRDYMDFKLKRNEFYSITPETVQLAFPQIKSKEEAEEYHLQAFCSNAIEDVDDLHINISFQKGINIGVFGRINKDYVLPMTIDLIQYIKEHKDLFFNIVYIGDSPLSSDINKLGDLFEGIPNARLSITGYLCPVPISFMNKFDFFISSAGSAWATQKIGFLTIAISGYTYKSNGILGYQTDQSLAEDEHQYELKESLDDLIIFKKYEKKEVHIPPIDYDYWFMPHLKKMHQSIDNNSKDYYDMNSLNLSFKCKILTVIMSLLSPRYFLMIRKFVHQI